MNLNLTRDFELFAFFDDPNGHPDRFTHWRVMLAELHVDPNGAAVDIPLKEGTKISRLRRNNEAYGEEPVLAGQATMFPVQNPAETLEACLLDRDDYFSSSTPGSHLDDPKVSRD